MGIVHCTFLGGIWRGWLSETRLFFANFPGDLLKTLYENGGGIIFVIIDPFQLSAEFK